MFVFLVHFYSFSGFQLCRVICSSFTKRCSLNPLLLRPASDPAAELPGAQCAVGTELRSGEQRREQYRRVHAERPDPDASVSPSGASQLLWVDCFRRDRENASGFSSGILCSLPLSLESRVYQEYARHRV